MKVIISGDCDGSTPALMRKAVRAAKYHVTEVVLCKDGAPRPVVEFAATIGVPVRLLDRQEATQYAQALVAVWDGKSTSTKRLIDDARGNMLLVHVYRAEEI
jgi:hypothetical protein